MSDITMIALVRLIESSENVRKTDRRDGISQLAASLKAHGLLQSLVVRATEKGKFAVVAGGRRLRALRMLAKAGDIEKNTLIPCRVISGDENATELSLAENTVRLNMSLADEIEAVAARIEAHHFNVLDQFERVQVLFTEGACASQGHFHDVFSKTRWPKAVFDAGT